MSTPRTALRRTAVLTTGLAATAGLVLLGSSSAAADPPQYNVDLCEQTLLRVAEWPSTSADDTRSFSDGFDSYLSRQPACTTGI